jgi:hypothetical protein
MSKCMRIILIAIILFSCLSGSYCQHVKPRKVHRLVPFFLTWSPEILSKYLTSDLNSDSEKVAAIHSWITWNVDYDVQKYIQHDYARNSIRKILWQKKAICTGYSDLFTTLCDYAGIKSVQVPGYTKNINVDILDSFYMDDHMWNAVSINGKWHLVDATWDAGYITYYKKNLWCWLVYYVSLKQLDIYIYKPHFVRHPIKHWYLATPGYFLTDHVPLNTAWMLEDRYTKAEQFARDSSFYYKRYKKGSGNSPGNISSESQRNNYYDLDTNQRAINDGKNGIVFNPLNHYCYGIALELMGTQTVDSLHDSITDSTREVMICNRALQKYEAALTQFDSNLVALQAQRNSLTNINDKKRDYFRSYHPAMLTSTSRVLRNLRSYKHGAGKLKKYCSRVIRYYYRNDSKFHDRSSFYRGNYANKTSRIDSLEIAREIVSVSDSITKQESDLKLWYNVLDSEYNALSQRIASYNSSDNIDFSLILRAMKARSFFFDDIDLEVKKSEDLLIPHKQQTDSILFSKGDFILTIYQRDIRATRHKFSALYYSYRHKAALFRQLKSAIRYTPALESRYLENEDSLDMQLELLKTNMEQCQDRLGYLIKPARLLAKNTVAEIRVLKCERAFESSNSEARTGRINKTAGGLSRLTNIKKAETLRLMQKVENHKNKYLPLKMRSQLTTK